MDNLKSCGMLDIDENIEKKEDSNYMPRMEELTIDDDDKLLMNDDDFYTANLIYNFINDENITDEMSLDDYLIMCIDKDNKRNIDCVNDGVLIDP